MYSDVLQVILMLPSIKQIIIYSIVPKQLLTTLALNVTRVFKRCAGREIDLLPGAG